MPALELWVGGTLVQTFGPLEDGPHVLSAQATIAGDGPVVVEYLFLAPTQLNLYVQFDQLTITGPLDTGAWRLYPSPSPRDT